MQKQLEEFMFARIVTKSKEFTFSRKVTTKTFLQRILAFNNYRGNVQRLNLDLKDSCCTKIFFEVDQNNIF